MSARTLGLEESELGVPHRLEKGTSAGKDARPRNGWIVRSHINWRRERVLLRTKFSWGGEQNIAYKDVETSS